MAIDQNFIPTNLRPLNLNPTVLPIPTVNPPSSSVDLPGNGRHSSGLLFHPATTISDFNSKSHPAAEEFPSLGFPNPHPDQTAARNGAGDQPLSRKVKFLCSFGGKILPRPSDGALRYVGGQTRIIAVKRIASFEELMKKMVDAYCGPVALKYQLPEQDLDSLVSVSCPEDLENMMEEYDKLGESSREGSAKLRVFLFSATELDSSGHNRLSDPHDAGKRYVDALNGIPELEIRRKDSIAIHNSDAVVGHTLNGNTLMRPLPSTKSMASSKLEPAPSDAAYMPQVYGDHHKEAFNYMDYLHNPSHFHHVNPQQLGLGGAAANLVAFPPHSYVPAIHITTTSSAAQLSNMKPVQSKGDTQLVESSYGGSELYGWYQGPPQAQGQPLRVASMASVPSTSSMFHRLCSEDAINSRPALQRLVTAALPGSILEHPVESMVTVPQIRASTLTQIPEAQCDSVRVTLHKADGGDQNRISLPPGSVGLPPVVHASYGLLLHNLLLSRHDGTLPQQVPPQYLVEQDMVINKLGGSVVPSAKYGTFQNLELPHRDFGAELPCDFDRPIEAVMAALRVTASESPNVTEQWKAVKQNCVDSRPSEGVMELSPMSPSETSEINEPWRPFITPDFSVPNEFKPENSGVLPESGDNYQKQAGGKEMLSGNALVDPSITPDGSSFMPLDQIQFSTLEVTHFQNPLASKFIQDTPLLGNNPELYQHQLDLGPELPISQERLLEVTNATTNNNVGDFKVEPSRFQSTSTFEDLSFPPNGSAPCPYLNAGNTNCHIADIRESFPSNSNFSNMDPRIIAQNTNFPPPKPRRVVSKESLIPRNSFIENHSSNSGELNMAVWLEEGAYYQASDLLNIIQSRNGSAGEHVKQEVQAVAEGVTGSVVQSSTPLIPGFYACETNAFPESIKDKGGHRDNVGPDSVESSADHKPEDIKAIQLDRTTLGFPITEDIGRLQIIKNSDLEELRELGSGTFGTVYHGKWRGSDVAIKRINDRCFAGKASEQERLRADFWNEARKLADLHHPNVLAFYGVVVDAPGGSVATVTEYMVNGSLRHALLNNYKTLDCRTRLLIAMNVAFGMEYLHMKNVVHFDLKSDNLLVNLRDPEHPICKVGDLGLSKVKWQTLISGGVRGTLPWMAPELLNGSSNLVSEKVDVFSFGIVMWELLTGEEPYADLHYGAIIGGIISNTLRPPVPESCDPEWRSLMEKCWSSEPSERPNFTEIASKLRSMDTSLTQKGQV